MTAVIRNVVKTVTSHQQEEGAGFVVRRPLPTAGLELMDPFLLLDEMGPVEYRPGQAKGAPDHPHRGFETVSYILRGEVEHEDSAGHRGLLKDGDVQWMTAGAGIIHSEMPSRRIQVHGGTVHGFQLWVNLPARLKMTRPRYQDVLSSRIPRAQTPDGKAAVKVIAGSALGVTAVIDTHTPIVHQDWTLQPGADVTIPIPADHNTMVYVFDGQARVGDDGTLLKSGQLGVLGAGDAVRLRGVDGHTGRLLLLAGVPMKEPVARYGPFVMNTRNQLLEAMDDFENGRMGEITRTAQHG